MGNCLSLTREQLISLVKRRIKSKGNVLACKQYSWEQHDILGVGSSCIVFCADYKPRGFNNNFKVAVKRIAPEDITTLVLQRINQEATILEEVSRIDNSSTHFIQLQEAYIADDGGLCIVTDIIPGLNLLKLTDKYPNGVPEYYVKYYVQQIIEALQKLHDNDIAHLDLKLENIIIDVQTNRIKLIDFGFASKTTVYDAETETVFNTSLTQFRGSPHYCSPEIVRNLPYDGKKSDLWALGVLTYTLLASKFPFEATNTRDLLNHIINEPLQFPDTFSSGAVSFISSLLCEQPSRRPEASWMLCHPWLVGTPTYQLPAQ